MATFNVDEFEISLSVERLSKYLTWAVGDRTRAVELYTLNAQLSEALYIPLQMLEVALRNRIHAVLSVSAGPQWFDHPDFQRGSRQAEQLAKAKQDLIDERKALEPGRIVAALTFGYWTGFFGSAYEDTWRQTLRAIAQHPEGRSIRRKDFSKPLTPIRILRNRVAHHEPILGWDLPKHYGRILQLTEWLSPTAAAWCRGHCRFDQVHPATPILGSFVVLAESKEGGLEGSPRLGA